MFTNLYASSWSTVGQPKEKGLFDFDFITWMAWTWPTASFFIFIAICITVMYFWEKKVPGGSPRRGILGLDTTRATRTTPRLTFCGPTRPSGWARRPSTRC